MARSTIYRGPPALDRLGPSPESPDYFSCHIWESEVHCASFVIRKPKTGGPYWWVKQK